MNVMKKVTSVTRMRLVETRKDLTNASAKMVSMVTATTAQVSQCFIFLLKQKTNALNFFLVVECLRIFCGEELMFIESSAMGLVRVNEIPVKSISGKAAVNIILLDILLYIKHNQEPIKGSWHNIPFHRYGGHVEFIRLKEYYGMPRGALAQYLHALFGQKENFTVYFRGKRRTLLNPNTAQRSFFPITIFF